jgi:hypothetical protein
MEASMFDELPSSYRIGLRLRALGADDELIAECLGIDAGNVVALLDIGAHKLENIQRAASRRERTDRPISPLSIPNEDGGGEALS